MIHIFLRLTDTDARQEKKSNQVRNSHESVHDIRKNPDGFQLEERAAGNEKDKNQTVRENALRPHEINHAAFAIVVPAQYRRESKENKTDQQHVSAKNRKRGSKRRICKRRAVFHTAPYTGDHKRQAGQCTDNDGVNKSAGHGNKTLLSRPFRFSGSRHDWSRTEARFIGEYPRATPFLIAIMTVAPRKPPVAAVVVKALSKIMETAAGTLSAKTSRTPMVDRK